MFLKILHGEQYIEFGDEFPGTEGTFQTRSYIADMLDKGSSAVAVVNSEHTYFYLLVMLVPLSSGNLFRDCRFNSIVFYYIRF